MGWNTSALFVRRPARDVLHALDGLYAPNGQEVTWDEAQLGRLAPCVAVGDLDGWVALWNPAGDLAVDDEGESFRRELSRGGEALAVQWASYTDFIGFRYYADGELVRAVLYERKEPVDEEGDAIPLEDEAAGTDDAGTEEWLFGIVEGLTGRRVDHPARYRLLAPVR